MTSSCLSARNAGPRELSKGVSLGGAQANEIICSVTSERMCTGIYMPSVELPRGYNRAGDGFKDGPKITSCLGTHLSSYATLSIFSPSP